MPNFLRSGTTDYKFILCFLRILVLLGIFLVALFVRIDPILMTPEPIQFGFGPFGDSTLYHTIAYNLYAGNGYSGIDNGRAFGRPRGGTDVEYKPAVTRGPVYPVFLAAVYRLWGDAAAMQSLERWHLNWDRVRIVQSVLDALLCLVLFSAMRILYPGRYLPAILAAALYSISFYNIYYTRMLLGEGITTFLVTIGLMAGVLAMKSGRLAYWFVFGAGFGLASLSRPEYILFPFFMAAVNLLLVRREIKKAVQVAVVLFCGLAVVIAPWALRNYSIYKKFIPTSVGAMGFNLFTGTYEDNDWQGWSSYPEQAFKSPEMKKEVITWRAKLAYHLRRGTIGLKEYDSRFKALALETIIENPLGCLMVWIRRLPRLWYQNYILMYRYREPSGIWFLIYFPLSIAALILAKPAIRVACAPIFLLFIYMNLVYLPFHIEPRYGVPMYPGLCFLSAVGLWLSGAKMWGRFRIALTGAQRNN